MMIETGTAKVNGTQLYYEVAGSGPSIALIHGFTLDTRMWDDQFEVFAKHYRVIRYDVRGFGQSALPTDESYSHVDDLKALLNHLGVAQAHLIGLSMGGGIAIDFALTHPKMITTLIAVDSGLDGYSSAEFQQTLEPITAKAAAEGGKAANEVWLDHPFFIPARENPVVGARLMQIVGENSGWHWVNSDPRRSMEPLAIQRLHEVTTPTLIIVGQRDESYVHEIAGVLQQNVRHAQVVVLPDVGHMANMEAPALFNAAVLSFLQSKTDSFRVIEGRGQDE